MSNYETRHPDDMVLHPLSEIREWDEALAVLGIQDSSQTPADAIRERDAEIERQNARIEALEAALREIADEGDHISRGAICDRARAALEPEEEK